MRSHREPRWPDHNKPIAARNRTLRRNCGVPATRKHDPWRRASSMSLPKTGIFCLIACRWPARGRLRGACRRADERRSRGHRARRLYPASVEVEPREHFGARQSCRRVSAPVSVSRRQTGPRPQRGAEARSARHDGRTRHERHRHRQQPHRHGRAVCRWRRSQSAHAQARGDGAEPAAACAVSDSRAEPGGSGLRGRARRARQTITIIAGSRTSK